MLNQLLCYQCITIEEMAIQKLQKEKGNGLDLLELYNILGPEFIVENAVTLLQGTAFCKKHLLESLNISS